MQGRGMRSLLAVGLLVLAACVDHQQNALRFCTAVEDALEVREDETRLAPEVVEERADGIAEQMRFAEDGTRAVREGAREVIEAYDDLVVLLEDEDAREWQFEQARERIEEARQHTRRACSEVADVS